MRWLFSAPIEGLEEASKLIVAVLTAAFFPMAIAEGSHVSIRFLGSWLGARAGRWLDLFGAIATLTIFVLLAWELVRYTAEVWSAGERMWTLGWPVAPWWVVATAFIIACVPIQVIAILAQLWAPRSVKVSADNP